jgi:hypothetical protein
MDDQDGHAFQRPGRRHISKTDLIHQTELRVRAEKRLSHYLCPYKKCKGGYRYSIQAIKSHLRENGRNGMLMHSMVGGDPPGGYSEGGVWVYDGEEYYDASNVFDDADLVNEHEENLQVSVQRRLEEMTRLIRVQRKCPRH